MKRYLDFRFDVTDLTLEQRGYLAGEVAAQSERSDGHPSVDVESEYVENPDACGSCGREDELDVAGLCDSCQTAARYDEQADAGLKLYVANLSVTDAPFPGPAGAAHKPVRVGDEGVLCLYGDDEGGTCQIAAYDADDAERRLVATFGDDLDYIDCIEDAYDQRPLSIRYTAGLTDAEKDDLVLELLRIDSENGGGVL